MRKITFIALCAFMLHPAFAADSSTTPTFATPNYVNGAVDEIKTRIDNTINTLTVAVNEIKEDINNIETDANIVKTTGDFTINGTLLVPTPELPTVQ